MTGPGHGAWQAFLASLPPELRALHNEPSEDVLVAGEGRPVTVGEVLEVPSRQIAPVSGPDQRRIRQDRYGAGLLAAAWRHAVFRQARAVLALFDAGLALEAQANARACIEHAIALQRRRGAHRTWAGALGGSGGAAVLELLGRRRRNAPLPRRRARSRGQARRVAGERGARARLTPRAPDRRP